MSADAFAQIAGWSALVAALATVVGMITLLRFFRVGGRFCGFIARDQSHPLAVVGGGVAFVGSLAFQFWIGFLPLTGRLTILEWNA